MKHDSYVKKLGIKKEQALTLVYIVILFIGIVLSYDSGGKDEVVETSAMPLSKKVVVLDVGHGGWDPGKVGEENNLEKDINLGIAKKLQAYLEQGDSYVLVTRLEDEALGDRKMSDLNERRRIVNESGGDIFISIHQNSYPNASVRGSQVFYYSEGEDAKVLAECIQNQMKNFLSQTTSRTAKANNDYYMLKQTMVPAVIVECGFLSSPEEGRLLVEEDYQEKVAWAMYLGIIDYFYSQNL